HLSRELTAEVRQLADTAVRTGELGELEEVYLALLTLGSRLSWQPLADLAIAIEDRATLRRTAHLVRALKEDWPVFAAAAIWTRAPGPLSEYLVREGRKGLQALQLAMRSGDGAVRLLLDRG